jgi:hypothetical protein
MKKVYLGFFALTLSVSGMSQQQVLTKNSQSKNMPTNFETVSNKGKQDGYTEKAVIFQENFDTWPLTGWTIQGGPASTVTDPDQAWHEGTTGNPGSCASVLYVNSVDQHDEQLISPAITLPAGGDYYFAFDFNTSIYWHATTLGGTYDNANIYLQASSDNGVTWSSVLWQEDDLALLEASFSDGWETYVWKRAYVNVSSYAGQTVKFRMTYYGLDAAQFSLDNVVVEDIPNHDIRVSTFSQAVPTTEAGDYYIIPTSQTSFPGLTFGAKVQNIGVQDQAAVALNVSGSGYNESSASAALNSGDSDSLTIAAPFMIPTAVGNYPLALTMDLGANTDENLVNNTGAYTIRRDNYVYARDNGVMTGGIGQIQSQDAVELFIGNIMEVFDDMNVTGIQIRLTDQAAAVGQLIDARIQILNQDGTDFIYHAETDVHEILASDLDTFVTIPIAGGNVAVTQGSIILVMAHHYGGTDEVAFGMAQNTSTGSVMGRNAQNALFTLTDPAAIMIRLTEDPSLSVKSLASLEGVKVYPNPSNGLINVSNDLNVENTIVVTDLTGKQVTSKVASTATTVDLSSFGAGVYMVEISNLNGKKVERIVVQ